MQVWEYCAVVGLSRYDVRLVPGRPALWNFTPYGIDVIQIDGEHNQEATEVARTIAELGEQGWEMTGCANTSPYHFIVFFKRPGPEMPEWP